jgi:hypothetical protein
MPPSFTLQAVDSVGNILDFLLPAKHAAKATKYLNFATKPPLKWIFSFWLFYSSDHNSYITVATMHLRYSVSGTPRRGAWSALAPRSSKMRTVLPAS